MAAKRTVLVTKSIWELTREEREEKEERAELWG